MHGTLWCPRDDSTKSHCEALKAKADTEHRQPTMICLCTKPKIAWIPRVSRPRGHHNGFDVWPRGEELCQGGVVIVAHNEWRSPERCKVLKNVVRVRIVVVEQ